MNTYKLKEGKEHLEGSTVPGYGVVTNGVIKTERDFENPNFDLVTSTEVNQAPTHMNGVAPQSAQPVPPVQENQTNSTVESENKQ